LITGCSKVMTKSERCHPESLEGARKGLLISEGTFRVVINRVIFTGPNETILRLHIALQRWILLYRVTNNLERRLYEHESGYDPKAYTFKRRPLRLVFNASFNDIHQAIAFEKQVKGWNRKKKEAIIDDNWHLLPELSKRHGTT